MVRKKLIPSRLKFLKRLKILKAQNRLELVTKLKNKLKEKKLLFLKNKLKEKKIAQKKLEKQKKLKRKKRAKRKQKIKKRKEQQIQRDLMKKAYIMYIVSSKNNVIVTVSNTAKKNIFVVTAGQACKEGKLSRSYRKQLESHRVLGTRVRIRLLRLKAYDLLIYFKGMRKRRFRRIFFQEISKHKLFKIHYIGGIGQTPHNGCRARKLKRTRWKRKPFKKIRFG